jgi:hypothetical protein
MGKHNANEFLRPERDLYPTPETATATLLEHIDVAGKVVWEMAAGPGKMSKVLQAAGARVYSSDIFEYPDFKLDEIFDFVSADMPKLRRFDWMITNPPGGLRNSLAVKFIECGLARLPPHGGLALLLPMDFDSAVTRRRLFEDCPTFYGKIVIRGRIVWFKRSDGEREAPKENYAWFLWRRDVSVERPVILYATSARGDMQ